MSDNLSIESPDFDRVRKESGYITEGAIRLLWNVLNQEIALRRLTVRNSKDTFQGKSVSDPTTSSENNLDTMGATVWWYNTASSVNLTGLRNGQEGRVIFLHNIGAGTITIKYNSGSSDAANRIITQTAADVSLTTNKSFVALYINSLWRELKLA